MEKFRFKKSLGQNFLKDKNIIHNIVDNSLVDDKTLVIEIGPGSGALTFELALVAKYVLAYEIDTNLESVLANKVSCYNNVNIIFDDFMKRNVVDDIKDYKYETIAVVANIPYYITTPIIMKLIQSGIDASVMTLMVQKEVGDRLSAKCGCREYDSITVFLNYYFNIKKLFIVSRNSFVPKPNVDSIVIQFLKKDRLDDVDINHFQDVVTDAFQFKRKNLRNNLKKYDLIKVSDVLGHFGYDLNVRAEQLPLEVFVELSKVI